MKKALLFLVFAVLAIVLALGLSWMNKTRVAAHMLEKHLKVPVSMQSLEFGHNRADAAGLKIGNPPHSRTPVSFSANQFSIEASLQNIFGNPLIIEEIDLSNIFIGIEYYNSDGTDNNWKRILDLEHVKKQKKGSRDYLIRTLILTNLTVQITKADGSVKRYPTIPRMEFHNISSETGFPVEEIEKAIFDLVMKDLFRKLGLDQLMKTLEPLKNVPTKYLPSFFK